MKTDKELADRLEALGILRRVKSIEERDVYQLLLPANNWVFIGPASHAVRDWRVAGQVMERLSGRLLVRVIADVATKIECQLPRAIIEAGCEALSDE